MNSKLKLRLYFILLVILSVLFTLLAFVTSLVCHSSVLSLTALFHFSQLIFYATKLYLLLRKEKDKSDGLQGPTRLGILIDLICSVFVSALCFSIIVKSIQYFFGHGHEKADERNEDQLHHDHENLSQYDKIMLMSTVGVILFICDIVFLVLNFKETVLRQSKKKPYAQCETTMNSPGSNPNRTLCTGDNEQVSFKPFGNCKIRKENCYLIVPSDLVKMRRKVFFTLAFLSGPLAILINSLIYTINYDKEHPSSSSKVEHNHQHHSFNTSTTNNPSHKDHHDDANHHHHGIISAVAGFFLINIDPILSIVLCLIYAIFFVKIFKIAALILAQSVPLALDVEQVKRELMLIVPRIKSFHEFYLFEWTPFNLCVSMHFVMERDPAHTSTELHQRDIADAVERIRDYFSSNYLIHSLVIQPEFVDDKLGSQCCEECHIKPKC